MYRQRIAILALCLASVPAIAQDTPPNPNDFEGGRAAVAAARERVPGGARARNVILFIGDGMGVSTVTAARIFEGQLRGESGEENRLAFEGFPNVALVQTYNTNQQTPDSAGTMTAIVTGSKTRAGVLSIDRQVLRGDFVAAREHPLPTLLEHAEGRGLATGIVTTTTVTHATPAALYAHSPERDWQSDDRLSLPAREAGFPDIARQLLELDEGDGVDVVLGGGRTHFLPAGVPDPVFPKRFGSRLDERDLIAEWVSGRERAAFVATRDALLAVDSKTTGPLLGLFAPSHLAYEADRLAVPNGEPSLTEMTAVAISILERNAGGYFLTIEGGRIDHAHHAGNARRALRDTVEFSNAVRMALELTNPADTLIVVTADHSHVLTMAGYPVRGNDILGKVVTNDKYGEPEATFTADAAGRPYTTLGYQNGPGARRSVASGDTSPIHSPTDEGAARARFRRRPDLTNVDTTALDFLQEAAVPLGYETHGGEDVAAYAMGPGSELIQGVIEQNYLYHAIVDALGWNRRSLLEPRQRPTSEPEPKPAPESVDAPGDG
jgi:alkaline phosphatase